jgi:hypothetical protein
LAVWDGAKGAGRGVPRPSGAEAVSLPFMGRAAEELGVGPEVLYKRFAGWTVGRDERCQVCGRTGHVVTPGGGGEVGDV